MGAWGGWGAEGGREDDRTHEGDKGERKKEKGRGQCRRTEPEALKFLGKQRGDTPTTGPLEP